jgi:hypothetical protein
LSFFKINIRASKYALEIAQDSAIVPERGEKIRNIAGIAGQLDIAKTARICNSSTSR